MHITMLAAISSDGFIAARDNPNPQSWTSAEDALLVTQMVAQYPLQVMGQTTYDIHRPKPSPTIKRVVLTHSPDSYKHATISGQLEFYDLTPKDFVEKFKAFERCLLLGGSTVYTSFLEAGLVSEFYLTVEPVKLKSGVKLLTHDATLETFGATLVSEEVLNTSGTVLKHYVLKK